MSAAVNLLLADDDTDDCFLFNEALGELSISAKLTTVHDGVQLMQLLAAKETPSFDAIFLDLNMPRKNGFECLSEIKIIDNLIALPVIIYSTSLDMEIVDLLYQKGAHYYIRKPGEYDKLKSVIFKAVTLTLQDKSQKCTRADFILQP